MARATSGAVPVRSHAARKAATQKEIATVRAETGRSVASLRAKIHEAEVTAQRKESALEAQALQEDFALGAEIAKRFHTKVDPLVTADPTLATVTAIADALREAQAECRELHGADFSAYYNIYAACLTSFVADRPADVARVNLQWNEVGPNPIAVAEKVGAALARSQHTIAQRLFRELFETLEIAASASNLYVDAEYCKRRLVAMGTTATDWHRGVQFEQLAREHAADLKAQEIANAVADHTTRVNAIKAYGNGETGHLPEGMTHEQVEPLARKLGAWLRGESRPLRKAGSSSEAAAEQYQRTMRETGDASAPYVPDTGGDK